MHSFSLTILSTMLGVVNFTCINFEFCFTVTATVATVSYIFTFNVVSGKNVRI